MFLFLKLFTNASLSSEELLSTMINSQLYKIDLLLKGLLFKFFSLLKVGITIEIKFCSLIGFIF